MNLETILFVQVALLCVGGAIAVQQYAAQPVPGSRAYRAAVAVAVVVGLLASASYTRFGKGHEYGPRENHVYHFHDIFHYAVGAKYYPELGYYRMYDCTLVALEELRGDGVRRIPKVPTVRSLEDVTLAYVPDQRLPELVPLCHGRFGEARWREFKDDIRTFVVEGQPGFWRGLLFDLGFNPPPSWNVFAHPLANAVPINAVTLELLPFLDMILLFVVGALAVGRAFGPLPAAAYLTVLGTNWLASYMWTGGSYFRQVWFGLLVLALCELRREKHLAAGVLMGLCTTMRIFPVFFAVGAGLALAWRAFQRPEARPELARYAGGYAVTVGVVVAASLLWFDVQLWADFFDKIGKHGAAFWVWHIGYQKYAVFGPEIGNQDFWYEAGLPRWVAWQEMLRAKYAAHHLWFDAIKYGMLGSLTLAAARRSAPQAAMIVGGASLFFTSMPANYYYVFLAMMPVVFWSRGTPSASAVARMALLFALPVSFPILSKTTPDALIQNGYVNVAVFWFWVAMLASLAVEAWQRSDDEGALIEAPPG